MDTWLVIGLGNPGPRYAGNRHNVGAMVVAELAGRSQTALRSHKARAAVADVRLGTLKGGAPGQGGAPGPRATLAVPTSYMNECGAPVKALAAFYRVEPARLVVVHDDLDIEPGRVRLKLGGGEGGHNGLRSISSALGTRDYLRIRVGIGRPPGRMDPAGFVLRDFAGTEKADLPLVLAEAADAVEHLVTRGLGSAQRMYHR